MMIDVGRRCDHGWDMRPDLKIMADVFGNNLLVVIFNKKSNPVVFQGVYHVEGNRIEGYLSALI